LEGTLDPRYAENEQQFSYPSDVEIGVKGLIGAATDEVWSDQVVNAADNKKAPKRSRL
jgi:hypothetical protein